MTRPAANNPGPAPRAPDAAPAGGRIFDVQRFSIHDGPGIRTTVFLKGCPLRCRWCHNPEGIRPEPLLAFEPAKCIGCGACLRVCPRQVHRLNGGRHVLDRARCQLCGACAEACCTGALEIVGRDATVAEVMAEVLADRCFYDASGGGMTLSGGEPIFQVDFSWALLSAAKAEGLHTAVETCGFAEYPRLRRLLPVTDLWLFDIKAEDDARHEAMTGVPLGPILENLRRLEGEAARLWLRLPLVPGLNDTPGHFDRVAGLVRSMPRIERVELLPYHPLGTGKYERMGLAGGLPEPPATPNDAQVERWLGALRSRGVRAATP